MTIKSLHSYSDLPRNIRKQIDFILQERTKLPEGQFLFKRNGIIWSMWKEDNVDFTRWCAILIISSFFHKYLSLLNDHFEKKYNIEPSLSTTKSQDLQSLVLKLKTKTEKSLEEIDIEWINREVFPSFSNVVKSVTTNNITSINDLVILSNMGNRHLSNLSSSKDGSKNHQVRLRQALLTYISDLIESNFIDEYEYKSFKHKLIEQHIWRIGTPNKLAEIKASIYSRTDNENSYKMQKPQNVAQISTY